MRVQEDCIDALAPHIVVVDTTHILSEMQHAKVSRKYSKSYRTKGGSITTMDVGKADG